MTGGLYAFIFVLLVVVIIFLVFQVTENSNKCKESRKSQQDRIKEATRNMVTAATQSHPLLKYEFILRSRIILDELLNTHGSSTVAERTLKMDSGTINSLQKKLDDLYIASQDELMSYIVQSIPQLDIPENADAGLRKKHRKKRHHKRE